MTTQQQKPSHPTW